MADDASHSVSGTETYTAFGLTIASCIHCPELSPAAGDAVDVVVRYGDVPHALTGARDERDWYQAAPGQFLLQMAGVGRFLVRNGNEIVIDRDPAAEGDVVRVFLLGSAFGALLHQRGNLVLHGSTVQVGAGCVVFLGRSGAGKSTMAASLRRRGYRCLGDDVCPVSVDADGVPVAAPAYPQAKLWADALQRFGIDESGLRRIRGNRPKHALSFHDDWHATHIPITHLYVLSPAWRKVDPILQPVSGPMRVRVLRDYTYRVEFLQGLDLARQHFAQLAYIAGRLPITRVVRPTPEFGVEDLADVIEKQFATEITVTQQPAR